MKRTSILTSLALLAALSTGHLWGDEIKGQVKSVDPDKSTITLAVGDAEKTLNVAPTAKITGLFGKKIKKATTQDIPGGLKGVKEGTEVTVTTASTDGKDQVTELRVEGLQAKMKKKKKDK
jgi:Cu/Ag efflux protein CusF